MEDNKAANLTTAALALLLGITLGKILRKLVSGRDPLTLVGDSSRVIAAWRAIESLESEASRLFYDPLSFNLAGDAHVQQCLKAAKRVLGHNLTVDTHRFFQISLNGIRVWWFDQQIIRALTEPTTPSSQGSGRWATQVVRKVVQAVRPTVIRQVVVIGSGMDTRPWRLDLPQGVKWFEIDTADVLKAKTKTLKRLGASFQQQEHQEGQGQNQEGTTTAAYPLKTASWTSVAVDVSSPGWCTSLVSAGFNSKEPTLWVLEGLLMYLDQAQAEAVLAEAAQHSALGSKLLGHTCNTELIEAIHSEQGIEYPPFTPELVKTWKSGLPLNPEQVSWGVLLFSNL